MNNEHYSHIKEKFNPISASYELDFGFLLTDLFKRFVRYGKKGKTEKAKHEDKKSDFEKIKHEMGLLKSYKLKYLRPELVNHGYLGDFIQYYEDNKFFYNEFLEVLIECLILYKENKSNEVFHHEFLDRMVFPSVHEFIFFVKEKEKIKYYAELSAYAGRSICKKCGERRMERHQEKLLEIVCLDCGHCEKMVFRKDFFW